MKVLVFNGWAAGPETWALCTFPHDWVFSYLEELDSLPERVIADSDDVLLIGFSMGGNYAMRMLMKYPEKVRGIVFVSTSPFLMEDRASGWHGLSERRLAALRMGTELVFGTNSSPLYEKSSLERGLDYLRTSDLREKFRAFCASSSGRSLLRIPVFIFQSERDGIVRPQNADYLAAVFPQAKVIRVPGNEHSLPVTIPGQIDEAVMSLL